MIIGRTPFRISFFGGGTDYPVWYRQHGGATLATTINKYCYLSCRWLPPFFEYASRIVWSKIEMVKENKEIQHPAVREVLRFMNIDRGIELHHNGDLPARTGLGSSSSFTVCLLHALHALQGISPEKMRLAREAIRVEQDSLKENVGSQDQVIAAFGGFNRIDFKRDGEIRVDPIVLDPARLNLLQDHLMLVYTGLSRNSSEIAAEQVRTTDNKKEQLRAIHQMVDEAIGILQGKSGLDRFGQLLHESWILKRSLTDRISTPLVDQIYETAIASGAVGGKLLGAGGGGFLLLFVRPEDRERVSQGLDGLLKVPFRFENSGSRIIFSDAEIDGALNPQALSQVTSNA